MYSGSQIRTNQHSPPSLRERLLVLRHLPRLFRLVFHAHRTYTIVAWVLRIVRSLVPLAFLWVGKLIIDAVVAAIEVHRAGGDVVWNRLSLLVLLELSIAVVSQVLGRISALVESLLGDLVVNDLSERMLAHAAELDLGQFEDSETYDRLERARRQIVGRVGVMWLVLSTSQDLVTLVSLAGALVVYVPWLLVLVVIAVVPAFVGEARFAQLGYSLQFRWTPERRELDYLRYVGASDQFAKEIKLFGLSDLLRKRYACVARSYYEANKQLSVRRTIVAAVLGIAGALGYYCAYAVIIVMTVSGAETRAGVFTIGVLTLLAGSVRQSRDLIQRMLLSLAQMYEHSLYVRDLFAFLELTPTIRSKPGAPQVPRPIREGFVFEDVGFRYPGVDKWAVRHLTFALPPRHAVALVGKNGAGKTTLVKLLARLYDPEEGRIVLDGVDLRDYDLESLHQNIGVIFQDFLRYEFSLKDNIGVGQVEHIENLGRIQAAAKRSLADELAGRFERGYEQRLGRRFEDGVQLSGGEWQKVALGRAYMREAQILILDEPTAALDARAEHDVFQRFTWLMKERIAVLISHRFSTVRMVDHILVLQDGFLVQQGTHERLLDMEGPYAELFGLQAAGYR